MGQEPGTIRRECPRHSHSVSSERAAQSSSAELPALAKNSNEYRRPDTLLQAAHIEERISPIQSPQIICTYFLSSAIIRPSRSKSLAPKSRRQTVPSLLTTILPGCKSPWTTPRQCTFFREHESCLRCSTFAQLKATPCKAQPRPQTLSLHEEQT